MFNPDSYATRAEFTKLVDVSIGISTQSHVPFDAPHFRDVPAGKWYTPYINAAAANGIVKGYPQHIFQPNADITVGQAVAEVVRALGYGPSVLTSSASGYVLEASGIEDMRDQRTLLDGVPLQLRQPTTRDDAARLVANALYALPANDYCGLPPDSGVPEPVLTPAMCGGAYATTLLQRLAYSVSIVRRIDGHETIALFYPGYSQTSAPMLGNYEDIVTGTRMTGPALRTNQVRITELSEAAGTSAPQSAVYTVAPRVALVGATGISDLVGSQVSYVTNTAGEIVFIDAVTPPSDVLSSVTLETPLSVSHGIIAAVRPAAQSTPSQVELQSDNGHRLATYKMGLCGGVACAVGIPTVGTYTIGGGIGISNKVTAVLNPDGSVIALISDGT